ncbi:MAG: hypothetical protein JWN34_1923 [Bryobacterales bacterium]|jgi:hypothetical protein|nr:hypothetical protein [Bryobacterales bacterium]
MVEAGARLRKAREDLGLKFRDVEAASQKIAERHKNQDFVIFIGRLSDIENHGTLPSIFRLYSLCCIYRLRLNEVLSWFGIPVDSMAADAAMVKIGNTHLVDFDITGAEAMVPISLNPGLDLRQTMFLTQAIQRWGKMPLALVGGIEPRQYHYGFMGTEDDSMNPAVPPGSLLVIDHTKRRIQTSGWESAAQRPIYFLQHKSGCYCRWVSVQGTPATGQVLSLMPDPASHALVLTFPADEVDVLGQVVGLAISLDLDGRRRPRA